MCNTMGIRYEERNGKKYAYRCTSKRVPGKKNPVSMKEYLGAVDPDTGNLIPKKISTDTMKFTLKDGSFRVKDYGNVMVAKKVCDDLCLLDDLSMSFAGAEKPLLCLAMAQALLPTPYMDTDLTLESTYIRESIGVGEMDFSSQRMSEITRTIGEATGCMEDFFTLRARRSEGSNFLYDITSQSTYSEPMGMAEWGKDRDGESLKQMNIGLVTNDLGNPIAFDLFPGLIADMTTLKGFVSDMKARVPGCTLVMDRGFENAGNVEMAFDIFKSELDGRRGCMGDLVRARGRLFIKFLALMIRVRMQRIVSGSGIKGLTVENMLLSAGTYKIIDDRGMRVRTERTKRVREIFALFDVDDPDQLPTTEPSE